MPTSLEIAAECLLSVALGEREHAEKKRKKKSPAIPLTRLLPHIPQAGGTIK